ncbi:hypothetical protein, partial [Streptomyces sp. NPDC058964]|uniref:hypothetical protein n=1 Tax=Streptomyces sp. NPDC058964 TaxID=3346681 RepID=UPI003686CBA2
MGRHARRRGGLAAAVCALTVAVAAATVVSGGGEPARAATAQTAGTTEIVLDDPRTETPRGERLLAAGQTGFLHQQGPGRALFWTSYKDGDTVSVITPSGMAGAGEPYQPTTTSCWGDISASCPSGMFGQGADTVALPDRTTTEPVSLWTPDGSAPRRLDMPRESYVGTYGTTVVASEHDPVIDTVGMQGTWLKLIDVVDGKQRNRWVTGYPTDKSGAYHRTGDATGALLTYPTAFDAMTGNPTSYEVGYLDFATAEFTTVFSGADSGLSVVLTADRIGWYSPSGGLHLKPRADLTAQETVPVAAGGTGGAPVLVGNWLVLVAKRGPVTAVSLTDGSTKTLLTQSYGDPVATPDGRALVTGGTGAADWWVQRISQNADGTPQLEKVSKVPPYENAKTGIALSRGSLRVAEVNPDSTLDSTSIRTLTTNGSTTLTASTATTGSSIRPVWPDAGPPSSAVWGNHGPAPPGVYHETLYEDDA